MAADSELVRLLQRMREDAPMNGVKDTQDLDRAINLAKLQSSQEAAAAGALQAAARLFDRLVQIGNTASSRLTERQQAEYAKFSAYIMEAGPSHPTAGFDVARWLRDLSAKTGKLVPREYGVAVKHKGYGRWAMPEAGSTGSLRDAQQEHDSIVTNARAAAVVAVKIVSRTKAGAWEFEETE